MQGGDSCWCDETIAQATDALHTLYALTPSSTALSKSSSVLSVLARKTTVDTCSQASLTMLWGPAGCLQHLGKQYMAQCNFLMLRGLTMMKAATCDVPSMALENTQRTLGNE